MDYIQLKIGKLCELYKDYGKIEVTEVKNDVKEEELKVIEKDIDNLEVELYQYLSQHIH